MFRLRVTRRVLLGLTAVLSGCMAMPFASWQPHEYEGELAPNPIFAVEDGRRVEFAQVTITQRRDSPYNVHPRPVLVERASTATPTSWPVWTSKAQLNDHRLLEKLHNQSPLYRYPQGVGSVLGHEPTLVPWDAGYIVATRPFAVAFPVEQVAFAVARRELERGGLSTRKHARIRSRRRVC